jgi:hypothetical protein
MATTIEVPEAPVRRWKAKLRDAAYTAVFTLVLLAWLVVLGWGAVKLAQFFPRHR